MKRILALALAFAPLSAVACGGSPDSGLSESEARAARHTDDQIKNKLKELTDGIVFISEGDSGYSILEGEALADGEELKLENLRVKLKAAVLVASQGRDISRSQVRARALNPVDQAIAEFNADGNNPSTPEDEYKKHDRQMGKSLGYMKAQLRGVIGYTFGENASGDQDEEGPVLYIWAGVSKTTGKVIAIMTSAVYT